MTSWWVRKLFVNNPSGVFEFASISGIEVVAILENLTGSSDSEFLSRVKEPIRI
jgi:hypothetical protein